MNENKEKKPMADKIEDAVDEALFKVQNAVYGERKGMDEDIPSTMEEPSGFRRINKFATRRNIGRKILKHPKILLLTAGLLVLLGILAALL